MQRLECHHGRALIEGALGRAKHFVHQVLFTAREDKMNIVEKLDIRPQESLCTLFGIVCDSLELVDGYINLLAALLEIFKNTLHGIFCVRAFDSYGYCGGSSHWVWTDGWSPMTEVAQHFCHRCPSVE